MKHHPTTINPDAMIAILRLPDGDIVAWQELALKIALRAPHSWDGVNLEQSDLVDGWLLLDTIAAIPARVPYRFGASIADKKKQVLDRDEREEQVRKAVQELINKAGT